MTYIESAKVESHIQGLIEHENARHETVMKAIESLKMSLMGVSQPSGATGEPTHREPPTPTFHRDPAPAQSHQRDKRYGKRGRSSNRGGPSQREQVFKVIGMGWFTVKEISSATGLDSHRVSVILGSNKQHIQKRQRGDGYMEYHLTGTAQRQFAATASANGTD